VLLYDYYFYLSAIALEGLRSLPGLLSVAFFLGAIVAFFKAPRNKSLIVWVLVIIAVGLFTQAFVNTTYEFDEQPETLDAAALGLPEGEPDCGTAWTGWLQANHGLGGSPCPRGCYRGLTLRKQMQMKGLPPWPHYRRELQCWRR
jgi:hypothetical protein